jgi:uncharacterized membrane protein YkoI
MAANNRRMLFGSLALVLLAVLAVTMAYLLVEGGLASWMRPQLTTVSPAGTSTAELTTSSDEPTATTRPTTTESAQTESSSPSEGSATTGTRKPTTATSHASTVVTPTPTKVTMISLERARQIALSALGKDSQIVQIAADLNDNPPKYEVFVSRYQVVYEVEIHAITGAVIYIEEDDTPDD